MTNEILLLIASVVVFVGLLAAFICIFIVPIAPC